VNIGADSEASRLALRSLEASMSSLAHKVRVAILTPAPKQFPKLHRNRGAALGRERTARVMASRALALMTCVTYHLPRRNAFQFKSI
jgi:hypothetical protein